MEYKHYPKVWQMGHAAVKDIFDGPIVAQEKIDGSQLSFGRIDGALRMWSRRKEINLEAPGMFEVAVKSVRERVELLTPDYIYRGEYLSKLKHNALKYERVPFGNIILFDVSTGIEQYLSLGALEEAGDLIELESVPCVFEGKVDRKVGWLKAELEKSSVLGGPIEGIVVKNYNQVGVDGAVLMGKYVTELFREVHRAPGMKIGKEIVFEIVEFLRTEARWQKAYLHLLEEGEITKEPRDIGSLVASVQGDVIEEEIDMIKDALWGRYQKDITKGVVLGLAEWYKRKLYEDAYGEKEC